LGACSLRAVQLRKKGGDWHIHHWLNIEHEPNSNEIPQLDYEDELQLAFGPGTFSGRRTAMLINPPDVEYKLLEVPPAVMKKPSSEIRDALQFELDRQLPWPVSESEIAIWPVQPGASSSANAMIAAAQRNHIQHFLEIMDSHDLECASVDIVPNAMIELYKQANQGSPIHSDQIVWAVLDIGLRSSRLYLVHDNHPIYARVVCGGGLQFTESLTNALHVDFRIAEQYKRIYGIQQTDRGYRSMTGGLAQIEEKDLPGVLYAILNSTFEELCNNIERSYRFAL